MCWLLKSWLIIFFPCGIVKPKSSDACAEPGGSWHVVLVAVQPLLQGPWPWCSGLVLEGPSVVKQLFQITVLRGENASAKTLQSVVKSLESDKLKLEEKVKNLEQKLKENNEQPLTVVSPSGKARATPVSVPSEPVRLFLTEPRHKSHCTLFVSFL